MNIILVHPSHGAKVAINELELERDEAAGWTRYTAPEPTKKVKSPKSTSALTMERPAFLADLEEGA